jgi:hypothetical protein
MLTDRAGADVALSWWRLYYFCHSACGRSLYRCRRHIHAAGAARWRGAALARISAAALRQHVGAFAASSIRGAKTNPKRKKKGNISCGVRRWAAGAARAEEGLYRLHALLLATAVGHLYRWRTWQRA